MPTAFAVPVSGSYEWPMTASLESRFWQKVARVGDSECWEWLAFRNPSGYGMIRNGSVMALAPRVAWVIANGPVPDGKHVLHTCDNRGCVNIEHLYVGTNRDNIQDKVRRGRASFPHPERRGEKHPMAKLSDAEAALIRETPKRHGSGVELARRFNVSVATISKIRSGGVRR